MAVPHLGMVGTPSHTLPKTLVTLPQIFLGLVTFITHHGKNYLTYQT